MQEMNSRVTKLQIFREKGRPGEECLKVHAIEGAGLEGDRHADGGEKQISLLDRDTRLWMEGCRKKGLCFARFKENIQLDGQIVGQLHRGDILILGTAQIEITGRNKRCFEECELFRSGEECRLSRRNAWGKVAASGVIALGDRTILE